MEPIKIQQLRTLFVGITWSLFSSVLGYFLIANNSEIQKQEITIQNFLMKLRAKKTPPEEVLVLKAQDFLRIQDQKLDIILAEKLLKNGAATVVINYPERNLELARFKSNQDKKEPTILYQELTSLIEKYKDEVVVVAPIAVSSENEIPVLPNPYRFLEVKVNEKELVLESEIKPNEVKGFFEYNPSSTSQNYLNIPVRYPRLSRKIIYPDSDEEKEFKSAALLALEKYSHFLDNPVNLSDRETENLQNIKNILANKPSSFLISYWKPGTFEKQDFSDNNKVINIDYFCPPPVEVDEQQIRKDPQNSIEKSSCEIKQPDLIKNKIIFISSVSQGDSFLIQLPSGEISAVEVQANILANLLTESWFYTVPNNLQLGLIILISTLATILVVFDSTKSNKFTIKWVIIPVVAIGGYGAIVFFSASIRLILPVIPLLTFIVPGVSVPVVILINKLFAENEQQQIQIAQMQAAQRQQVLAKTQKVLHRIASDIHDEPLQELSLAIKRISIFELDHPNFQAKPIVNDLRDVGIKIRKQLNNISAIADKLEINPELDNGLHVGMKNYLQKRQASGELTLTVIDEIKPLPELKLDSDWLDAREDIYRFFKEAINNVIRHGQNRNQATKVRISLFQQENQCTLEVENDGDLPPDFSFQSQDGGNGTKSMEKVAQEIPGGSWKRLATPSGGVLVQLNWTLNRHCDKN